MALADNIRLALGSEDKQFRRHLPVVAGAHIYRGAKLGWDATELAARPFVDGDALVGIALEEADATNEATDGALYVWAVGRGTSLEKTIGGSPAASDDSIGSTVYITADDTISVTDSGTDTVFGSIIGYDASLGGWHVFFEAAELR